MAPLGPLLFSGLAAFAAAVHVHQVPGARKAPWSSQGPEGNAWQRIAMAVILGCAGAAFAMVSLRQRPISMEHGCCWAYIALAVALDFSLRTEGPLNPVSAVLAAEALKLLVSGLLFALAARTRRRKAAWPSLLDALSFLPAALLQALASIALFRRSLGTLGPTAPLFSAALWPCFFQQPIDRTRVGAIGLIFLGWLLPFSSSEEPLGFGALPSLLLALAAAAGGVASEYALKRSSEVDLNVQNCLLCLLSGGMAACYFLVAAPEWLWRAFFKDLGAHCAREVLLQAMSGLAVSCLLKHVDAVTVSVISALRAPSALFLKAWALRGPLHGSEILAAAVVCSACFLYLRHGPLTKQEESWKLQLLEN